MKKIVILLALVLSRSLFAMEGQKPGQLDSYYDILNVERTATSKKIAKTYKKLSLKHHPDKNPNNPEAAQKFLEIQEAYENLRDPERREIYDTSGYEGLKNYLANKNWEKVQFNQFEEYQVNFETSLRSHTDFGAIFNTFHQLKTYSFGKLNSPAYWNLHDSMKSILIECSRKLAAHVLKCIELDNKLESTIGNVLIVHLQTIQNSSFKDLASESINIQEEFIKCLNSLLGKANDGTPIPKESSTNSKKRPFQNTSFRDFNVKKNEPAQKKTKFEQGEDLLEQTRAKNKINYSMSEKIKRVEKISSLIEEQSLTLSHGVEMVIQTGKNVPEILSALKAFDAQRADEYKINFLDTLLRFALYLVKDIHKKRNSTGLDLIEHCQKIAIAALKIPFKEYPDIYKKKFETLVDTCQKNSRVLIIELTQSIALTNELQEKYFCDPTVVRAEIKSIQKHIMQSYARINAFNGEHQIRALRHFYQTAKELASQGEFALAYETLDKALGMSWGQLVLDNKSLQRLTGLTTKIFINQTKKLKSFHQSLDERMKRESHYNLKKELLDEHQSTLQWLFREEKQKNYLSYQKEFKDLDLKTRIIDSYFVLGQKLIESSPACALEVISKAFEFKMNHERELQFKGLKLEAEFYPSNEDIGEELLDIIL